LALRQVEKKAGSRAVLSVALMAEEWVDGKVDQLAGAMEE